MPHRRVVFDRIEDERIYQDARCEIDDLNVTNTVADYLTYMWVCCREAERNHRAHETSCLRSLRKTASLGVACMEKKGCRFREVASGVAQSSIGFADRADVFEAIDGERKYQDEHFPGFYIPFPTVGPTLTLLRSYLRKADQVYQQGDGVLEVVREITAICVRCLETLGCPQRAKD